MYRLTTLGACSVADSRGSVLPAETLQPKRMALLAYLATARPRGPQRRDNLVALFWPELDEARSRAALRQALHAIRRSLRTDVIISHGLEALELSHAILTCDALDFESAVVVGDHARALTLYGEFLAGLHLTDSPEFERWIDTERRRLRVAAASSAWTLADRAASSGSDAIIRSVHSALALSDLDEGAVRRAMRLLAEAGERAAAISVYEKFADELRSELDVDVDPATRALADELRRPPVRAAVAPRPAVVEKQPATAAVELRLDSTNPPSQRKRLGRWRVATGAALSLAAVITASQRLRAANSTIDARRLFVSEFSNETTIVGFDTVAHGLTNRARAALSELQGTTLTDDDASAGTRVRGSIQSDGDSIAIRAEVVDVATRVMTRVVVRRVPIQSFSPQLASEFSEQLSAATASALYPGWSNVLSLPATLASYQWFVSGLRDIKLEQHQRAIAAFLRAYAGDTTFATAGILAAMELYQVRNFSAADSLSTVIGRGRALRPLDDRLLEWTRRSLEGDRFGARAAMRQVVALAPKADLAWIQLAIDNVETARPVEAIAALDHIDPEVDRGEGWAAYWATRIEALHLLGDNVRELAAARDGLRRHPELKVLRNYELRALAALGQVRELDAELRVLPGKAESDATSESMVRQVALELRAHGHEAASRELLDRLAATYAQPESSRDRSVDPLSVARTYYLAGEDGRATAIYDSVYRRHPNCSDCAGALGVLAARRGDRLAVERYSRVLSGAEDSRFQFGRALLWESRIANTLGDRDRASALLVSAFRRGLEFDIMTHADPDLRAIKPDSIYRRFAHSP
jgi:DNA-binding SARP family transcriptional activator